MKKGLKIVIGIVVCIYLIVVIFTTGFLLNKNDYGVSQFLGKYLIAIDDDSLTPDYKEHSLLVLDPVKDTDIEIGDRIFYYDATMTTRQIKFTEVTRKEKVNDNEVTYVLRDNTLVSSQYVLGSEKTATSLSFLGKLLYILQSKWGFLLIVVFPLFLAFIYEIYAIIKEFKKK